MARVPDSFSVWGSERTHEYKVAIGKARKMLATKDPNLQKLNEHVAAVGSFWTLV